jgi:DNA-directed RNA polymerase subunit alpha
MTGIMAMEALSPRIERLDDGGDPTYGKYTVEPLERGYGTTLGNALRRVLLSSIPGASVTFVRLEGVLHEFSTIPGVVEDTSEILLNLKQLAIRITGEPDQPPEGPRILRVKKRGPGELAGADIECPSDVEIINKDCHIATLDSDQAEVNMEMEVETGRGYVPSEEQDKSRQAIGSIPMDSIYTPVRRVAFRVEPTRVGHLTDFDRLILEVTTNGTIAPHEAISEGAKILDRYLILFFDFQERGEELSELPPEDAARQRLLETRVDDLDFSVRTMNCLRREGIAAVGQLIERSDADLMAVRNFGRKSLQEVKDKLATLGLSLRESDQPVIFSDEDEEDEELAEERPAEA